MYKKVLIFSFFLLSAVAQTAWFAGAVPALAQDMDSQLAWAKTYNGPGDSTDVARIIITVDFPVDSVGVYVVGHSFGDGTDFDYATVKYDQDGNQLWEARYNGPGDSADIPGAIVIENEVWVTGTSYGDGTGFDYATVAYDTGGTELWVARYNGPANGDDRAYAVAGDTFGNIYVTGKSWTTGTDFDYATIKYDPDGDSVWVRTYNGPGDSTDVASGILVSASGDVYVTGTSWSDSTNFDYATIKYDSDGNEQWIRRYNGPDDDDDYVVEADWLDWDIDPDSIVVVTGYSWGDGTDFDYATVAYDTGGTELWVARYNGTGDSTDIPSGISVSPSGSIFITGKSWGDGTDFDYATIKYDPAGNEQWVARYNGPADSTDGGYTQGPGIDEPISMDKYYVTGYSYDDETDFDCVTIKYDSSGNEVWVAEYDSAKACPDHSWSLDIDASGNIYVAGTVSGFEEGTDEDFLIIKYVQFIRGDVNGDGIINSADVVYLINYLFKGGPPPEPLEAGDVNCDGVVNSADVVYLINYLFKGGPPPGC